MMEDLKSTCRMRDLARLWERPVSLVRFSVMRKMGIYGCAWTCCRTSIVAPRDIILLKARSKYERTLPGSSSCWRYCGKSKSSDKSTALNRRETDVCDWADINRV
jgi:hypothetical protein